MRIARRRAATAGIRRAAAALAGLVVVSAGIVNPAHAAGKHESPPAPVAGDTLVANHSFEDALAGWSPTCAGVASVSDDVAWSGAQSLRIAGTRGCAVAGAASDPQPVVGGHGYTAYVHAGIVSGLAQISLEFFSADGARVGHKSDRSRPVAGGESATQAFESWQTLQVSARAPEAASTVSVVLKTLPSAEAYFDDVLVTADLTDLGPPFTTSGLLQGTDFGIDENGRSVAYSVVAGSQTQLARLIATDVETGEITLNLPLPDAYTSPSGLTIASDGRIYISGIDHFYQYTVGDSAVVDLGSPGPGYQRIFDPTPGENGEVYAGSYSSGLLFKYTPGAGFSSIGDLPVYPGQKYVRSVAHDPTLDLVYAGTGTSAHIVACPDDGVGDCASILPERFSSASYVYYLSAASGLVFARVSGGDFKNHMVVLSVSRGADGAISATVIYEQDGLGSRISRPVDGRVYYRIGDQLHYFDAVDRTEHDLGVTISAGIATLESVRLANQAEFPGQTVVGIVNRSGEMYLYNLETATLTTVSTQDMPRIIGNLRSLVHGPDGKVYASVYHTGGLAAYEPMRADATVDYTKKQGFGQAEGMSVLDGVIYQGIYHSGEGVVAFDPAQPLSGSNPQAVCDIRQYGQDRPYAVLGAAGKVYVGSTPDQGSLKGALTVYDPSTGECHSYVDIVPNQSVVGLAYADGKVYAGTSVWGNLGDTPTESEAKLVVFDPQTETWTTRDLPVAGLMSLSGLVTGPDGQIWCVAENYLLSYNPASDRWTSVQEAFPDLEYPADKWVNPDNSRMIVSDGTVYGIMFEHYLFSLDVDSGAVEILYEGDVRSIADDEYGNIYTILDRTDLMRYSPSAAAAR